MVYNPQWAIPFNIRDPPMEEQNFLGGGGVLGVGEKISLGGGGGGGGRGRRIFLGVGVSEDF